MNFLTFVNVSRNSINSKKCKMRENINKLTMKGMHSILNEMLTDEARSRMRYGMKRREISIADIDRGRVGQFEKEAFRDKIRQLETDQKTTRKSIDIIKHVRKQERNRLSSVRYNNNKREEDRYMRSEIIQLEDMRDILLREKECFQREIEMYEAAIRMEYQQPPNPWFIHNYIH